MKKKEGRKSVYTYCSGVVDFQIRVFSMDAWFRLVATEIQSYLSDVK